VVWSVAVGALVDTGVLAGVWTAGAVVAGSVAAGIGPIVTGLLVLVVSCVLVGPVVSDAAPESSRCDPPAVPAGVVVALGVLPTPTWAAGVDGAAGAPMTIGDSAEPELPFVGGVTVRSTGARATGPPVGGAERPGHPLTATSVLVKKRTHAAAATMDRVAPRVASKPLGVRTSSTSAGKRSS
jgi:hypothetical protein